MKRIHDGLDDRGKGIPIFLSLLDFHETLVRSFSKNTCTKSCKRRKLSNIFEAHPVICASVPDLLAESVIDTIVITIFGRIVGKDIPTNGRPKDRGITSAVIDHLFSFSKG
jgi:hypothetical protein